MNEELYIVVNTRFQRDGLPCYFLTDSPLTFVKDKDKAFIITRSIAEKLVDRLDLTEPILNNHATEYDIIPINKIQA